ncbi:glutamine synthetase family protein [Clostridium algoriphilum]|uniref:glutamine synthetase family protein n=1 Tax=Clostridium algoriphilum TaxID=198347 RepID=UPI001CF3EAF5|nr:glutamine synthetase family protein [Clostridium algoriphilum]MCB2294805.1 glutamine synthetase family protein [Clostridium algoriphilum]
MEIDQIRKMIEEKGIHTVEVIHADTLGMLGGKMIPTKNFLKNYDSGFAVCRASLGWDIQGNIFEGVEITDFKTGCPDVIVKPILSTFKEIPWRKGSAFVFGEIHEENGEIFKLAPREILKQLVTRYEQLKYRPLVGVELEFYLLDNEKQQLHQGIHSYSLSKGIELEYVLSEIRNNLEKIGIDIEATHIEYGPAQIEIIVEYGDALEVADKTVLLKSIVKEIARKHGLYATFMAKPWAEKSGSGFHVHQSLWDLELKNNIFQQDIEIATKYLAGLTNTLSEFMPFTSPSINSYKRFSKYSFAPINESWGHDNRTAAVRSLLNTGKGSRLEQRVGSGDANPYLVIASSLAGGLYGLENELNLYDASKDAYSTVEKPLPRSLEQALNRLEKSETAKKYFGEGFVKLFLAIGRNEVNLYEEAVTDWEFNRYFEYS